MKFWQSIALFLCFGCAVSAGKSAPDFTLPDIDGGKIQLKKYLGKPLYILFFTDEPGENEEAFYAGVDLDETYAGVLNVILVAVEASEELLIGMRYPMLVTAPVAKVESRNDKVLSDYGVTSLPSGFLISSEGKFLKTHIWGKEAKKIVADYLETEWQKFLYQFSPGKRIPAIILQDASGKKFTMGKSGKPEFWLFWTPLSFPSEEAVQLLVQEAKKYPNIQFFTVTPAQFSLAKSVYPKTSIPLLHIKSEDLSKLAPIKGDKEVMRAFPLWILIRPDGVVIFHKAGWMGAQEFQKWLPKAIEQLSTGVGG